MGRFSECRTITELNEARNAELSNINKEYQLRRKEILSEIPEYKRVPLVRLAEVSEPEVNSYVPFPIIKGERSVPIPANSVVFTDKGQVYI